MNSSNNKLIRRQIRKHLKETPITPELDRFLQAVSESYNHYEKGHDLLERTMERSSEELLAKNEQLKAKNDTLDSFVYRVSHDLKTPANNFISMLKMLNEYMDMEGQSPIVNKILSNLESASRTMQLRIHDLLEMTKVEHQLSEKPVPICLTEMVKQLETELQTEISRTKAEITTNMHGLEWIRFGKENMLSILGNLLSNALKYHRVGHPPKIKVSCKMKANHFELSVSDNGMGLDLEKDGKRLFAMFSRMHNHVEGTGIGLYLVKKIIETHGGSISVSSKIDHGTNFTISLPAGIIIR